MAFSGSLIQQILPCCQKPRQPLFRERVRSVIEVPSKSDSMSSEHHEGCSCQDKMMLEHRKHNSHGSRLDTNLSHTSSTKLTCGTLSPSNSWKLRHAHCCCHRPCRYEPLSRELLRYQVMNRREDLHYHSPYRRHEQCLCRCLHQIQEEDRFGDKNVFYDLSSARRTRKTNSYPTLYSNRPSYEIVDTRCTTSV